MKNIPTSFRASFLTILLLLLLTTFTPGCKTRDLQDQILMLNDQQVTLNREKDSLLKVLEMKSGEITILQTDTVRLAEQVDNLTGRNRSLAAMNTGNMTRLKNAEAANIELQAKASAEAEKNAALQNDLTATKERLAAIERDLAASRAESDRLIVEVRQAEEQRIADSIAEANKPVVVPEKTYGWFVNTTEASGAFGLGDTSVDFSSYFFGLTNVFGYSFAERLTAGPGIGVKVYNGGVMIPLYLDFRYCFGAGKFKPYVVADGGYLFSLDSFSSSGIFINPSLGMSYSPNNKLSIHLTGGPWVQYAPAGVRSTFIVFKAGVSFGGK